MSANSNTIEIKLKFLTERLDAIQGSVKELEGLKRSALSTTSALKGLVTIGALKIALSEVTAAFAEVKQAIDLGGELSDLSSRTGQTVSDLVVLRQAFENAGLGAGATGQLLNLLQKSLTGLNEDGEPTSKAFDRLGVSLESLKSQSAVGQIETLSTAFTQIQNPADRTRAAMELFGRSGGQMLAILSDSSAMGVARQQVGSLGETMEKNAAAFDKLGDSWDSIGLRMTQLFSGVAEELAPMLQNIADQANSLDLTEVGREIGDLVLGLTELLRIVGPLAVMLGTRFVLEKTLAGLAAFSARVAISTGALAAETLSLGANTAAQLANAAARAKGLANGVAGAIGPTGAVVTGAMLGYEIQDKVFNWGSSLAAGGASSEADVRATAARSKSKELPEFMSRVREVKSPADLEKLKTETRDRLAKTTEELDSKGWNQTMEKGAISGEIAALEHFLATLGKLDGNKIAEGLKAQEKAASEASNNTGRAEVQKDLASSRAEANRQAALADADNAGKLALLRPELKKQAAIVDSGDMVSKEDRAAAAAKVLEIDKQIHEVNKAISEEKKTQAKEAAEKAKAAAEKAKEAAEKANQREALGLEAQHASAVASGDTAEASRVKWMQDYSAALEKAKGAGIADKEGFAATSASAQFLQDKIAEKKAEPEKASFSAGHAKGLAAGEVYVPPAQNEAVAAQRSLVVKLTATNNLLQEYIRQKPVKLDQTARFEQ